MTGRKLSIVAVLLLSTLLWGTAVAAHQHWDGETEHCEFSLLPHAADVAAAPEFRAIRHSGSQPCEFSNQSHTCPFTAQYHSRAPPL